LFGSSSENSGVFACFSEQTPNKPRTKPQLYPKATIAKKVFFLVFCGVFFVKFDK